MSLQLSITERERGGVGVLHHLAIQFVRQGEIILEKQESWLGDSRRATNSRQQIQKHHRLIKETTQQRQAGSGVNRALSRRQLEKLQTRRHQNTRA